MRKFVISLFTFISTSALVTCHYFKKDGVLLLLAIIFGTMAIQMIISTIVNEWLVATLLFLINLLLIIYPDGSLVSVYILIFTVPSLITSALIDTLIMKQIYPHSDSEEI